MLTTISAWFIFFAIKVAPILSSCLITITYLPQIWRSTRTKNVDGISLNFWILLNLFLVSMVCNALGLFFINGVSALGYLITELINFGFGLWQLILVIVYGKENRKEERLAKRSKK